MCDSVRSTVGYYGTECSVVTVRNWPRISFETTSPTSKFPTNFSSPTVVSVATRTRGTHIPRHEVARSRPRAAMRAARRSRTLCYFVTGIGWSPVSRFFVPLRLSGLRSHWAAIRSQTQSVTYKGEACCSNGSTRRVAPPPGSHGAGQISRKLCSGLLKFLHTGRFLTKLCALHGQADLQSDFA